MQLRFSLVLISRSIHLFLNNSQDTMVRVWHSSSSSRLEQNQKFLFLLLIVFGVGFSFHDSENVPSVINLCRV